jgi:predicted nucleotidyltransferase
MRPLSDSFLQFLVTQLENENTIGVTMTGSYARGEDGSYSDVDIHCYVRQMSCENARLLQDTLLPEAASKVAQTLTIITEAGY